MPTPKKKPAAKKAVARPTTEKPPPEPEDGNQDGPWAEPDRDEPLPDTSDEVGA